MEATEGQVAQSPEAHSTTSTHCTPVPVDLPATTDFDHKSFHEWRVGLVDRLSTYLPLAFR